MCMIDDCETYSIYHEKDAVRAKKAHKCNECGRPIEPGETYRCTSGLGDGCWTVNKVCAHCTVAAKWLLHNCHGYMDTCVREDIEHHVEDYRRMDLARVAVGMRRKWKRVRRTEMMPIPQMPRPIKLGDAH